jgi:hypothetical protein
MPKWRNMSPSLELKMETVCFSKMLPSTDESTWYQNLEVYHHHLSDKFNTDIGLKQENASLPSLFNFTLEYSIKKV